VIDPADVHEVLALFGEMCDRSSSIVAANDDWTMSGVRATQYSIDLAVDGACLEELTAAGLSVLSEESGRTAAPGDLGAHTVVVDPLDGSTNASLGLPWCATSLCLVSNGVPAVSMVANLRTGRRYWAARGRGAFRDGHRIELPVDTPEVSVEDAIVAINGRPGDSFRPRQYRALGATALDLCAVADGGFDGYLDFDDDAIGVWDYLGAMLVVQEAGGVMADVYGREPVTLDHAARRRPVAATSPRLLEELMSIAVA